MLVACLIAGHFAATVSRGALAFLPLWFIGAGVNMWIGVTRAGYPISAELPISCLCSACPPHLLWVRGGILVSYRTYRKPQENRADSMSAGFLLGFTR